MSPVSFLGHLQQKLIRSSELPNPKWYPHLYEAVGFGTNVVICYKAKHYFSIIQLFCFYYSCHPSNIVQMMHFKTFVRFVSLKLCVGLMYCTSNDEL